MKNTVVHTLAALSLMGSGIFGTTSVTLAEASKQNETRFLQEAIKIIYEEDKDQTFTAQEILDDGYKLCDKIAEADRENNDLGAVAENIARSALGGDSKKEETENPDMVKAAEKFLCDN